MPEADFPNDDFIEQWFDSWCTELEKSRPALEGEWDCSPRRLALEALSDASAEQFLNPLVASHLRDYGRRCATKQGIADRVFWVRSEWAKVDLSYGLAFGFEGAAGGWERAKLDGSVGALGQIEVKVCYTHHVVGKLEMLEAQLLRCRAREVQKPVQRYHGLIWLYEHRGLAKLQAVASKLEGQIGDSSRLKLVRKFACPDRPSSLGLLWPSFDGRETQCGLTLALVGLV